MIRRILHALLIIALCVCGSLSAQTEDAGVLTLEECVSLAVQHNPG